MTSDRVPVAIIGGGFSGTILSAQLARRGIASVLVDGSGRVGKGVAYSTSDPAHLLNVRAEGMSAWSGEPGHFAERFEQEGGDRRGFAQRRLFGRYMDEILNGAIATGNSRPVAASASGAAREDGGWSIALDDGSVVRSEALVLAIGNQEPEGLRAFSNAGARFVGNPWGEGARAAVGDLAVSGGTALLIGTGLTMVDVVLSLDAAGYQGRIFAVSRRGLIPRAHADFEPAPVDPSALPNGSPRAVWRWLRKRGGEVGWRAAVDSLRPHSHALWQSFDVDQQQRFLRHARPWWDVHRHRIAPEVAGILHQLVAEGRLEIAAGKIVQARATAEGIDVDVRRRRRTTTETISADYAFNCTGPLHAIEHTRDPLLRSLLDCGQVRPDQLGIGLEVDAKDRAQGGDRLWALGPLTKGRYWEIVAVPDIREQAAAVADDIARELKG